MDQFFARLLLIDEGSLTLIFFGLIGLGGLFGNLVLVDDGKLRRATYFLALSSVTLAFSISQLGWMFVEAAAGAGFFSGAIMLMLSSFFFLGLGVYYVSAARSRDVTGTRNKAWLGFIPLANLWLLFKTGAGADMVQRTPGAATAHLAGNIALIVLALFLFTLSRVVNVVTENWADDMESRAPNTRAVAAEAQTVEEILFHEARLAQEQLPVRLDEITLLRTVVAYGTVLQMDHDVSEQIALRADFEQMLAEDYCREGVFGAEMARGATIVSNYWGPGGSAIAGYKFTSVDCR